MATPNVSTATSIMDYLDTKGQDSSFSARKKLYNDLGFNKTSGEFVGSSSQNLNLLKRLQTQDTPATPAIDATRVASTPTTSATDSAVKLYSTMNTGVSQTTPVTASSVLQSAGITTPAPIPKITAPKNYLSQATPVAATPVPTTPAPATPAPTATPTPVQPTTAPTPTVAKDTTTNTATGGVSASSLFPDIFGRSDDVTAESEADVVNNWLNSSEGQSFLNRQDIKVMTAEAKNQAAKAQLEAKYQVDKDTLEENLAEHGLAFSGIRSSKVAALASSLAASLLDADRELATTLLESDADLRDAILKGVADLAKDAADGRKEAIQQLNAIGYAVIGDELVPTLSAESGRRAEEAAIRSERRLQLAEERAENGSVGNTITLAEADSRGLPRSIVGLSERDVTTSFYSPVPPTWFKDKVEFERKQSLTPEALQKLWDAESAKYIDGTVESDDHKKATAYFKAAYGDAVDAETIQILADEVEKRVNGGESYKDAIQGVIEENQE